MDQQTIHSILSGRARGPGASLLRGLTWLLSKPYALLMRLRRGAYRHRLLRGHESPLPVLSVGNLTTGGTGKTPLVMWLCQRLAAQRRSPVILTRGYKAVAGRSDEAEMMWKATGVPVVADPDRVSAAAEAARAGADVLVLDDGFQHLPLRRDLDIVLVDATNPFGYGHVLPRGLLREPRSALRDADAVVITRTEQAAPEAVAALRRELAALAPRATMALSGHAASAVVLPGNRHLPPSLLAGKRAFAFCGIGNPESFFVTIRQAGAELVGQRAFDDHAAYDDAALFAVRDAAYAAGAEVILTTAKDRVKLVNASLLGLPLWVLLVDIKLVEGEARLWALVEAALKRGSIADCGLRNAD